MAAQYSVPDPTTPGKMFMNYQGLASYLSSGGEPARISSDLAPDHAPNHSSDPAPDPTSNRAPDSASDSALSLSLPNQVTTTG